MDRDSLAALLARGLSVEKIARRFGRHPSTVSYWMAKYGLEASHRATHAAKGGITREALEALVARGLSIAEIAGEVALSKATVRHWLRRYDLRTKPTVRREVVRVARQGGFARVTLTCRHHGETEFAIEGSGYYRCCRCRQEQVSRTRRRTKVLLVQEAGGRCAVCGYDRCMAALEFHHLDPLQKRLAVSADGRTVALGTVRAEAAKCVLLCSNCHAEVESGALTLAVK